MAPLVRVIWEGREAAREVNIYLSGESSLPALPNHYPIYDEVYKRDCKNLGRIPPPHNVKLQDDEPKSSTLTVQVLQLPLVLDIG